MRISLHRGTVLKATGDGLTVSLPVYAGREIGPLDHLAGRIDNHAFTDNDTAGASATETLVHVQRINAGDRVLVAQFDEDDFVVLGRLVTGVPV